MSNGTPATESGSNIFFMLISAAVFGYFGFGMSWIHRYTNATPPVLIPMIAALMWTMRAGAVAFVLSAVLSLAKPALGSLLYAAAGLLTALMFAAVAIWEMTNTQGYYSGVSPFLLIIFAAWNGYGSWVGLKDTMAAKRGPAQGNADSGVDGR